MVGKASLAVRMPPKGWWLAEQTCARSVVACRWQPVSVAVEARPDDGVDSPCCAVPENNHMG